MIFHFSSICFLVIILWTEQTVSGLEVLLGRAVENFHHHSDHSFFFGLKVELTFKRLCSSFAGGQSMFQGLLPSYLRGCRPCQVGEQLGMLARAILQASQTMSSSSAAIRTLSTTKIASAPGSSIPTHLIAWSRAVFHQWSKLKILALAALNRRTNHVEGGAPIARNLVCMKRRGSSGTCSAQLVTCVLLARRPWY